MLNCAYNLQGKHSNFSGFLIFNYDIKQYAFLTPIPQFRTTETALLLKINLFSKNALKTVVVVVV